MLRRSSLALALLLGLAAMASAADPPKPTPILLDTDIGSDIDDALALALAISSPEIELVGVTTCASDAEIRAKMALRLLHAAGREKIPVAFGAEPQPKNEIKGQYQYYYHPAVIYNRAGQPQKTRAVEFLYEKLKARPGEITVVAVGPLTNIARLLKEHPDAKPWIKQLVVMGGSLGRDYDGSDKAVAEWNFKLDPAAAQQVLAAKLPLTLVPLDATWNVKLEKAALEKLLAKRSLLTLQLEALYQMWQQDTPVLFDPVALAFAADSKLMETKEAHVAIDDQGVSKLGSGPANLRVVMRSDPQKFISWYVDRVAAFGETSLPRLLQNRSVVITDDKFPARVHAFEDYETDIEKRWWLSGRLEEKDVPQGKRAFRSHLTLDFDDLQGQLNTMYNAVVFNPVPGPPMGPNTRLRFRYKLHGTDQMRIQLYSLSDGFHRYLSLAGLKQDEWQSAVVDMTKMRRPDGTGGPLKKDERIDDIQFYVDPRATVLIDDFALYDAGDEKETRKYPASILFTGWFDTGKQGIEWPGKFETVEHEKPRLWKYARSVKLDGQPEPVLNVSLRGARQRNAKNKLMIDFSYRVIGKSPGISITAHAAGKPTGESASLKSPTAGDWQTVSLPFAGAGGTSIDELHFRAGPDATLHIDDVLLYEVAP